MNSRPPSINPEREKEAARLERLLAKLEAIPADRRDYELADVRAETVKALLAELKGKQSRV